MAKRVDKISLGIDRVYDPYIKNTKDAAAETVVFQKVITDLNDVMKGLSLSASKIKGGIFNADSSSVKGLSEKNRLNKEANALMVQEQLARKALAAAEKEAQRNKKMMQDAEAALQRQRAAGIKQMEREKKAAEEAARPYKQLEKALLDAKKRYQDLAATGLAQTKQGRDQLKSVTDLRNRYESLNREIGNGSPFVGRYRQELEGLKVGFSSVIGLAGTFGLAIGGTALFGSALKTLKEFDEGAADMAKTLGISKDAARNLSQELLKIDTRTSIDDLQKIAAIGGQLGISAGEILKFTEATDKLNVALGDEFSGGAEEITASLGGLRNVFSDVKTANVDDDLLKIGNALNVLGAEGSATAPVVSDFAGRIGGVGIPLGLTTDQVLGLSATLQELNVNAERGGTAISKVLQKMTVDTDKFAKVAGIPVKDFEKLVNEDLYGAFLKVVEGSKKFGGDATELGKILDGLGIDGAGASEVFLKLGQNTDLLGTRVKQAGDSLKETDSIVDEFNTKNNTLSANVEKLGKAWDDYIISTDSATGATGKISGILQFVAKNLPQIISLLVKLVAAFVAYRIILVAVNIQQQIAQKGLSGLVREMASLKGGAESAASGASKMGAVLRGISWTALITLALQLASAFYDIASGANQAATDISRIEKARMQGGEVAAKRIEEAQKKRDAAILDAQKRRNEGHLTEKELLKEIENANTNYQKTIQNFSKVSKESQVENYKNYQNAVKQLDDIRAKYGDAYFEVLRTVGAAIREGGTVGAAAEAQADAATRRNAQVVDALIQRISVLKAQQGNTGARNEAYESELSSINKQLVQEQTNLRNSTLDLKAKTKAVEDYTERVKDLRDAQISDEQTREEAILLTKLEKELKAIKGNGIMANELRIELENQYQRDLIKLQKDFNQRRIDENNAYWESIRAAQEQAKTDFETLQNENLEQELQAIDNRDKEIRLKALTSAKTSEENDNEERERREKSLEQQIETLENYGEDTIDIEIELAELRRGIKDQEIEDEKARQEELANIRREAIELSIEQLIEASKRREAIIDREIEASKRAEDALREQANAGNADASKSLAVQEQITNEKIRDKQTETEKQLAFERIQLAYEAIENFMAKGDSLPIATGKAITGIAFVDSLLSKLPIPKFYKGTKTTLGAENKPIKPGKDGNLIWADKKERILNPELSDKIPENVTNDEVVNGYLYAQSVSRAMTPAANIRSGSDSAYEPLLKEIQELKGVIKNKPEYFLSAEIENGIAKSVLATTKKGNYTYTNRYQA